MTGQSIIPEIFDARRRDAFRTRSLNSIVGQHPLWQHIAEDMAERLEYVARDFHNILILGPIAGALQPMLTRPNRDIIARPDAAFDDAMGLELEAAQYDLILMAGLLDCVNDLPGALIQLRSALRPDGLLLANIFGAPSLQTLKSAMLEADGERAQPHIHPQIDIRSAADLLARAGLTIPVADIEKINLRYSDWRILIADLRNHGLSNALCGDRRYLGRSYMDRLDRAWQRHAQIDGKVCETISLIHLSGWRSSPDQPKAAKRGSATASLAAALKSSVPENQ